MRAAALALLLACLAGTPARAADGTPGPETVAAGGVLATRHFHYRVVGLQLLDRTVYQGAAPGHMLVVVEIEARNIDREPRSVFIGTLVAARAGKVERYPQPVPVPGLAEKMYEEVRVGGTVRLRFAYELPEALAREAALSWEPARAGGRRIAVAR